MLLIREIMYCKPGKVRAMVAGMHRIAGSRPRVAWANAYVSRRRSEARDDLEESLPQQTIHRFSSITQTSASQSARVKNMRLPSVVNSQRPKRASG